MKRADRQITGGVYLIADAGMDPVRLLPKLTAALDGGIAVLQLYHTEQAHKKTLDAICEISNVPVLVNNAWPLLRDTALDGVHFDAVPEDLAHILTPDEYREKQLEAPVIRKWLPDLDSASGRQFQLPETNN